MLTRNDAQHTTRKPAGDCPACGGRIRTERGRWGVFTWRGDGRYRIEAAHRTYRYEPAAAHYAERKPQLVVRWLATREDT